MRYAESPQPTLARAPNFRDIGGLLAADGRRVRQRHILRSEGLHNLTDGDMATLDALGIRLVCDLRSGNERRHRVSRWPGDGRSAVLPIEMLDVRGLDPVAVRALVGDPSGDTARNYMLGCYRDMPAAFAGGLRAIVERILDRRALPLLLHCTAGKDRTGFACSVLLLALGASMDTVLDEYLRSERHYGLERVSQSLLAVLDEHIDATSIASAIEPFAVRPRYLEIALEQIDRDWGSIDGYLLHAGGLDDERRERLRSLLLE